MWTITTVAEHKHRWPTTELVCIAQSFHHLVVIALMSFNILTTIFAQFTSVDVYKFRTYFAYAYIYNENGRRLH